MTKAVGGNQRSQSDFIVYVDESGDHSLTKVDESYPIFVLAFCAFYQKNYVDNVVSAVERLKFRQFGHDIIVLHERDIRKELSPFLFRSRAEKEAFIAELTQIIADSRFILIAAVIDKRTLTATDELADNPYHIALRLCLDGLGQLLSEKDQVDRETHIVFESRGHREDKELELEFRRICDGDNGLGKRLPYRIVLANKKVNSTGLQLADLVARPIGRHYLSPNKRNRAFEVLRAKFLCRGGRANVGRDYEGLGLKFYPEPKSEKPR